MCARLASWNFMPVKAVTTALASCTQAASGCRRGCASYFMLPITSASRRPFTCLGNGREIRGVRAEPTEADPVLRRWRAGTGLTEPTTSGARDALAAASGGVPTAPAAAATAAAVLGMATPPPFHDGACSSGMLASGAPADGSMWHSLRRWRHAWHVTVASNGSCSKAARRRGVRLIMAPAASCDSATTTRRAVPQWLKQYQHGTASCTSTPAQRSRNRLRVVSIRRQYRPSTSLRSATAAGSSGPSW